MFKQLNFLRTEHIALEQRKKHFLFLEWKKRINCRRYIKATTLLPPNYSGDRKVLSLLNWPTNWFFTRPFEPKADFLSCFIAAEFKSIEANHIDATKCASGGTGSAEEIQETLYWLNVECVSLMVMDTLLVTSVQCVATHLEHSKLQGRNQIRSTFDISM